MTRSAGLAAAAAFALASPAAATPDWHVNLAAAKRYAESRAGVELFALQDERGRLHHHRAWTAAPSASLLKGILLVAYLNQRSVRTRPLTRVERSLLAPMIRRSANDPATRIVNRLGERAIERFARRAGMTHFELVRPWGLSHVTARDQARFFAKIDLLVVKRHREYARLLLSSVVPSQRWGIPRVAPRGWRVFLKGGWGSGTGRVTHQVALLERGERRVSLAVLTRENPSHAYGTQTVRGIAARLLRGLR